MPLVKTANSGLILREREDIQFSLIYKTPNRKNRLVKEKKVLKKTPSLSLHI